MPLHADRRRARAGERRVGRHLVGQRRAADRVAVLDRRALFLDRVDDQRDLVVLDHVDDVRAAFGHLVHRRHRHAGGRERRRGAARRDQREAELDAASRATSIARGLSLFLTLMNTRPCVRQPDARRELRLDERLGEGLADAHHLAGGLHLRAEDRVDAGELDEREHRFLHREVRRHDLAGDALRGERLPDHAARRDLGERPAGRLRHEGHGARRARIDLEHVDRRRSGSRTARSSGRRRRAPCAIATVCRRSSSCSSGDSEYGGSEHAESPECTPACSMCSMMPPMTTSLAVAQRVDVDLDRVVEEAVEQHRASRCETLTASRM